MKDGSDDGDFSGGKKGWGLDSSRSRSGKTRIVKHTTKYLEAR